MRAFLRALWLASSLAATGCIDDARPPDGTKLTGAGLVRVAAPSDTPEPPPPSRAQPPVRTAACVAELLSDPDHPSSACDGAPAGPVDDEDVQRIARDERIAFFTALSRLPPLATSRALARATRVRISPRDGAEGILRAAVELLATFEPDPPRWRAGIEGLSEAADCAVAPGLLPYAGQLWASRPELRVGALVLVLGVFERCHNQPGSYLPGTTTGEYLRRFGAPFELQVLDRVLDEFPEAFARLDALWPAFGDEATRRRSEVAAARLAAFVNRARGTAFCGLADHPLGSFDACQTSRVRAALAAYVHLLEETRDAHGLSTLDVALRSLTADPALDLALGDIVDELDVRAEALAPGHRGSRGSRGSRHPQGRSALR
jgi:hypothetical protein